ncbi:hypothetical protein, partial [Klebsiella pneumoniae]|uniref:hypothetical protein n=1 Tax=Klebsiella pneumoniae TaxID=573 RepID=UPI003F523182
FRVGLFRRPRPPRSDEGLTVNGEYYSPLLWENPGHGADWGQTATPEKRAVMTDRDLSLVDDLHKCPDPLPVPVDDRIALS